MKLGLFLDHGSLEINKYWVFIPLKHSHQTYQHHNTNRNQNDYLSVQKMGANLVCHVCYMASLQ